MLSIIGAVGVILSAHHGTLVRTLILLIITIVVSSILSAPHFCPCGTLSQA